MLDAGLEPVPVGVTGELYIGGDGLAREYLNRPELTAERFVPNPFDTDRSARLYTSGDFARYLSDGSIVQHPRRVPGVGLADKALEQTVERCRVFQIPRCSEHAITALGAQRP